MLNQEHSPALHGMACEHREFEKEQSTQCVNLAFEFDLKLPIAFTIDYLARDVSEGNTLCCTLKNCYQY